MNKLTITAIEPHRVTSHWWRIRSGVKEALSFGRRTHLPEDIREALVMGHMGLIIVKDGREQVGFAVYEIAVWPRCKSLRVVIVAGENADRWLARLNDFLTQIARSRQIDYLDFVGRKGWARKLGEMGWKAKLITMTRDIDYGSERNANVC